MMDPMTGPFLIAFDIDDNNIFASRTRKVPVMGITARYQADMVLAIALALLLPSVAAQDPAPGWMAYAVGSLPEGVDRITKLTMKWKVGEEPSHSRAFFSPWFGMDPSDNLNLIQPVNPWLGSQWAMYTEYFQWSPEHNSNSRQQSVEAGQTLAGSLVYDESTDSYELSQTVVETGVSSSQTVKCQSGKNTPFPYVVYEKTFPCQYYPPDEKVTFTDIYVECDGKDCTDDVKWEPMVKDANCNMQANIEDSKTISITWDTSAASKYDNFSENELFQLNFHGWATKVPALRYQFSQTEKEGLPQEL